MESGLVSDSHRRVVTRTYVLDKDYANPGWSKLSTRLNQGDMIKNVFSRDHVALSQIVEEWWIWDCVDHEKAAVVYDISDLRKRHGGQRRVGRVSASQWRCN